MSSSNWTSKRHSRENWAEEVIAAAMKTGANEGNFESSYVRRGTTFFNKVGAKSKFYPPLGRTPATYSGRKFGKSPYYTRGVTSKAITCF